MQEQFDALSLHRVGVSGRELTGVSGQTERFTQVRQLGEGSSCITYLALNSDGHRAVIKELYVPFQSDGGKGDDYCRRYESSWSAQGLRGI